MRYCWDEKLSTVLQIAQMAKSHPIIFPSISGEALVPCFATHNTLFPYRDPPTVEELDLFKQLCAIETDPKWYEIGMCIACVSLRRIVHAAYIYAAVMLPRMLTFELCTIRK